MQSSETQKKFADLKNGPVDNSSRFCTDFLCLLLFLLCFGGIIAIANYGYHNGQLSKIAQGYDSDHRACGVDSEVQDYPYIYFVTPNSKFLYRTVCVSSCPSDPLPNQLSCVPNSLITSCKQNVSDLANSVYIYNSTLFNNRVCLPLSSSNDLANGAALSWLSQTADDIKVSYLPLLLSAILAIILAQIYSLSQLNRFLIMMSLKQCAEFLVWTIIVFFVLLTSFTGFICFQFYQQFRSTPVSVVQAANDKGNPWAQYLAISILCWVAAAGTIILVACFFKRIKLAIAVLKVHHELSPIPQSAGDFIQTNPSVLGLPIISFLLIMGFTFFWLHSALMLYSCGVSSDLKNQFPFASLEFSPFLKLLGVIHVFGFFWMLAFFLGTTDFIISGSVCVWYFQQGQSGQEHSRPLTESLRRFLRYHLGSVALGSFLLAFIAFLRILIESLYVRFITELYINTQRCVESLKDKELCGYLAKCCCCCIWCFEHVMKFLAKNAYVQTNMGGKSFFNAAADALDIVTSHKTRFLIISGLGELITTLGRMIVMITAGLFFYQVVTLFPGILFGKTIVDPTYPTLVAIVTPPNLYRLKLIGYLVGSIFMGVFGMSTEAIVHLFCLDEDIQKEIYSDNLYHPPQFCPAVS